MGADCDGNPYLPNASRQGHYTISQLVTTDVTEILDLLSTARKSSSPEEELILYRSAFGLIGGEPLANALSGYSWWRSEGHEGRLTASVVDATAEAVRLATLEGSLDLAWWFIDKARLVDPYSELISRAAMATAAASGDMSSLKREWNDCKRRALELDPEGVLSPQTQRFVAKLLGTATNGEVHHANLAAIEEAL